jgi:disulfide bond formation protein DsbB
LCGVAAAVFHVFLQLDVIPESASPCQQGVSCADVSLVLFGFVSIPVLSLAVFSAVAGLLYYSKRSRFQ